MDSKDKLITELHTQLIEKEQEINKLKEEKRKVREYMKTLSDEYATNDYDIKCVVFNKLYYEILGDDENAK